MRRARTAAGFTLIEVMVTLALLSFGLLGLVAVQAKAMQMSVSAEDTSRASLLANELASTMWGANSITLDSGVIASWQARVANPAVAGLPNGVGTSVVTGNVAQITVTWHASNEAVGSSHQYVTQVLIP
jgi:type IV pilus assembly protein PilV